MISCKLQGGIGNQMFQVASIYALSLRNGCDCGFDLRSDTPHQGFQGTKYADSIFRNVPLLSSSSIFPYSYLESQFRYSELPFQDGTMYQGYFQSERHFIDYEEQVKKLFDIPAKYIGGRFTTVHVRRGDYLKFPQSHPVCSVDYYLEAMSRINTGVFLFISDDMQWVRDNFKGDRILYSDFDEITDLSLMVGANNHIGSNSSFSWWGSWLGKKSALNIFPATWFGPEGPDYSDVIPERWIKI